MDIFKEDSMFCAQNFLKKTFMSGLDSSCTVSLLNCGIKQLSELALVLFMCETEKPIARSSITAGEHTWYNIVCSLPYYILRLRFCSPSLASGIVSI